MLLHPTTVTVGELTLDAILAVTIDRLAAREIVEFSDAGPHATFADVPEQRTQITVTRRLRATDLAQPRPGDQADLTFTAATGHHDAGRTRVHATCVVQSIRHQLSAPTPRASADSIRPGALQTISLIALSSDSTTDPIALTPV
jgi:hypothetical protein